MKKPTRYILASHVMQAKSHQNAIRKRKGKYNAPRYDIRSSPHLISFLFLVTFSAFSSFFFVI